MKTKIYLDHAATTGLHPKALEAMLPFLRDEFGNPSGVYALGKQAAREIEKARESVAGVLECRAQEVVFTGPGTESINAAIKGVAFAQQFAGLGNHIVTTSIEHHAVLHSCDYLAKFGFETTFVPVDAYGVVNPEDVAQRDHRANGAGERNAGEQRGRNGRAGRRDCESGARESEIPEAARSRSTRTPCKERTRST